MIDRPFAKRHVEILATALELIAENGIAGTTMRDLANALGIKQPSLYHWFDSKEAMVDQIIELCAHNMMNQGADGFSLPAGIEMPNDVEETPAFVARIVLDLWNRDAMQERFVRFMFAVALEMPEKRDRLRRFFTEQLTDAAALVARPWVAAGDIDEETAFYLSTMIARAIGLMLIEQRILFDEPDPDELHRYTEFVVRAAVHAMRAMRPVPTLGEPPHAGEPPERG